MSSRLLELLAIMERLRAPNGCPWDRQQTFASIAPYTIEEAYEVADAIERGDLQHLKEELGDLLFQVVFHAQIAARGGRVRFRGGGCGYLRQARAAPSARFCAAGYAERRRTKRRLGGRSRRTSAARRMARTAARSTACRRRCPR